MDAIDQALTQVRAEIERIRQYLAQLQETEKELATLRDTRQVIAQQWSAPVVPTQPTSNGIFPGTPHGSPPTSSPPRTRRRKRGMGQPLAMDILQLLKSTGRPMAPIEIDTELRKRGREMHVNAVTSVLSRLLKDHHVDKDEGAKYSLARQSGRVGGSIIVSPTSLAGQAYAILKRVGTPLTGEQLAVQLQNEGREINPRSVITSLYHCAQDGQLFKLVGAKTFGLLEWGDSGILPAVAQPLLEEADTHQSGEEAFERRVDGSTENKDEQEPAILSNTTRNNNALDGMPEI